MSDSIQITNARKAIAGLNGFQSELAAVQRAIKGQAAYVAKCLTHLARKDPAALEDRITIAWVSHWAYAGLPLLGIELPEDVVDIIASYNRENQPKEK